MYGIVPKPMWSKVHPADDQNRVTLALRCLLIRDDGRLILIDTGIGNKWPEKDAGFFAINRSQSSLTGSLAQLGVTPDDITDVVLTHLHFDHAGGVSGLNDGVLVPAFPNARIHVQRQNWDWARSPSDRDRGSYRPENFSLFEGSPKLRLLDGPGEILPGVSSLISNGHTFGLQVVQVEYPKGPVYYAADLIPTSRHIHVPWNMAYDLNPVLVMEEKRALLDRVIAGDGVLFLEHDPDFAGCRVRKNDKGHYQPGDRFQFNGDY
ncbi:MAG: putative quorum-quenching lactonase YtnP [Myxococcota bacterium]|nr:putative quorum-quenching lactonase YtnP [Myxococcota bacterium]